MSRASPTLNTVDTVLYALLRVRRWWCGVIGHEMKPWESSESGNYRYRFCQYCAHHEIVSSSNTTTSAASESGQ